MAVSLVDGAALRTQFAASDASDSEMPEDSPHLDGLSDREAPLAALLEAAGLTASDAAATARSVDVSSRQPSTAGDAEEASAAPTNADAGESTESAGGDPLATGDLLNQIARCLPRDLRPNLGLASLVIKIDDGGRLMAAPKILLPLGLATAEERVMADRVVQAALLCGPYTKAPIRNADLLLVPDFSKLGVSGPAL